MIIGHTRILDFFATARRSGRLAHAYIFAGADGVGKRTVARTLAAELLGVPTEKLATHPDFVVIERLTDEATGKRKKEITVAQARELRSQLGRSAWLGGYQVAIINDAESLNGEAANALLKLLEEPGSQTIFFLLTDNAEALLPTIRSRGATLFFSLVPQAVIRAALLERGAPATDAAAMAEWSGGRPGRALEFLAEPDMLAHYQREATRFRSFVGQPFYVKAKFLETLFGKDEQHDNPTDVPTILMIWLQELRLLLKQQSQPTYVAAANQLMEAEQLIARNSNPRLLLETILISL